MTQLIEHIPGSSDSVKSPQGAPPYFHPRHAISSILLTFSVVLIQRKTLYPRRVRGFGGCSAFTIVFNV